MEETQKDDREHPIAFEPLVDSRTAAAELKMHYKTLERMARKGLVPATKKGGHWQFRFSIISDWINKELKSNFKTDSKADKKKEEPP
jgi:excisionase family DNA binding protein